MNCLTISQDIISYRWEREALYFSADQYFDDLILAIGQAKKSITLESFIFSNDVLGLKICHALVEASLRGVHVRLLIDGVGSAHWHRSFGRLVANTPLQVRLYHPLPWHSKLTLGHYLKGLEWLNKRNHRKACVIDHQLAFVGSFNITTDHLERIGPRPPWRDTGIALQGPLVRDIEMAFERAWDKQRHKKARLYNFKSQNHLVRLNDRPRLRKLYFKDLCLRLKYAQDKIWITNPYFVPDAKLLSHLIKASERGVDVRIILPGVSDMSLFSWINSVAARVLLKSKVRVFHFKERVLHAKVAIIDEWSILGSSNLNSRSLLHDLELDIVTSAKSTHQKLVDQFLQDQHYSEEVHFEGLLQRYRIKNLFFPFLRLIRYWI